MRADIVPGGVFPGYALPDLIGYGVYGLALSKLPATP